MENTVLADNEIRILARLVELTGKSEQELTEFMLRRVAARPNMAPGTVWWSIENAIQMAVSCHLPIDWSA